MGFLEEHLGSGFRNRMVMGGKDSGMAAYHHSFVVIELVGPDRTGGQPLVITVHDFQFISNLNVICHSSRAM